MSGQPASSAAINGKPLPPHPPAASDTPGSTHEVELNHHLEDELEEERADRALSEHAKGQAPANGASHKHLHGDELIRSDDPEHVRRR